MNTFFTSDTHAYHKNIAGPSVSLWKQGYRNFNDEHEMTQEIIKNINYHVGSEDVLYHLGDWSFGGAGNIARFRNQIYCNNIHLVCGNHDTHIKSNKIVCWRKDHYEEAKNLFTTVQDVLDVNIDKNKFFLSHYAHRIWQGSHKGVIHLYGHSHDNLDHNKGVSKSWGKSMDVGMDSAKRILGEYRPFSLEEINSIMNTRSIHYVDHHDQNTNV